MTASRLRTLARALLTIAAIGAVLVLGAHLVAPPLAVTAPVRTTLDAVRFIGPPLAAVLGVLALLRARRLERRARTGAAPGTAERDRGDAVFRGLIGVALVLMAVGLLSGLWTTLVLTLGSLLP